jgi:hypothetical protein
MPRHELAGEAADCRSLARVLVGRPEALLLVRIACAFDQLAVERDPPSGFDAEDGRYFAQRAAQEVTAAVKAEHPKARLAHLKIAQRYEHLAQEIEARRNSAR